MKTTISAGRREMLAVLTPQMKAGASLSVASRAFRQGESIPRVHSAYGLNASTPLNWTAGPVGTKSYVLFMEDPDAHVRPLPVVHWIAWNIPAGTQSLPEALPEHPDEPRRMRQGMNSRGRVGYTGPKPPAGDPVHHYNFQIFALDDELHLALGAKREELLEACAGRVLAAGLLIGLFMAPADALKS